MKKSIFLFFAAILCAMTANAAYNQSAKDLYFDNSEAQWSSCYVYIGHSSHTCCYPMTRVSGTQYLWQLAKANFNSGNAWNGASGWVVCKEKWWDKADESIDKYIWHGDKNVTKKSTTAWVDTKIYKTNGAANATSDGTTKKVYNVTSYTKSNYTVTINTVEGGTLTVNDYDNNAVATGASKIHLTVLKFSATPASGYVLDAVEINDGTNTTTIAAADLATTTHTLTSAVTINPVWRATTSTVTVTANATNGTVTGAGVYEEGNSVTLTATADAGYQFKNWTVGGAEVSTANPYTFTADADVEVVANFEELPKATIYFVNNGGWSKIQAYAWGDNGTNASWAGVDITANKLAEKIGEYDVYSYTVIQGSYKNVIFNDGSAQTKDYVWTDGNYYWHNEAVNFAGGTKADAESKLGTKTYTVVGSSAPLFGTAWATAETANDMTLVEGTKHELVKTDVSLTVGEIQYKVAVNHAWDEAYPAENAILNISEAGKYTVTFTFDSNTKAVNATAELTEAAVVLPTVGVKGAWDGWAATTTLTGDNTSAAAIVNITTADVYEFGLDVDGNFQASGATIDKANNSTVVTTNAGNMKLTANILGEYTFTWTYETNTLTVTYPAGEEVEIAKKYYIAGTEELTGFNWQVDGLQLTKDGDLYKHTFSALAAGTFEFKVTNGTWTDPWGYNNLGAAYEEVSQGTDGEGNPNGNIKFTTEEAKNITVIFDPATGKITIDGLTEKAPAPTTYTVAGDSEAAFGTTWDPTNTANDMALEGDLYKWTKTNVALYANTVIKFQVVKNHDWAQGQWPGQNNDWELKDGITADGLYTITITFKEDDKTINATATKTGDIVIKDFSNQPATLYFHPSFHWTSDAAQFAAYFYNNGPGADATPTWVNMTDGDGDGIYEVANAKQHEYVIICRMNPGRAENNWEDEVMWNQIEHGITIPNTAGDLNTCLAFWTNCQGDVPTSECTWVVPTPLTDKNWAAFVSTYAGKTINAVVERSFKSGQLHTLCLPFNLATSWLGDGAKAYQITSVVSRTAEELELKTTQCNSLLAGQPYIIQPIKGGEYEHIIVSNVTVENVTASEYTVLGGGCKVTMQAVSATDGTQTNGTTEYYIGAKDGKLYKEATNKLGLRALVVMTDTEGKPLSVRARVVVGENEETGIENIITTDAPVKVIKNGKLIIIRDGEKYNVQGMRL